MSSRYRKPLHARDFLQPVHDIHIVVDYQSMCHDIPWTPESKTFTLNSKCSARRLSPRPDGNECCWSTNVNGLSHIRCLVGRGRRGASLNVLALGLSAAALTAEALE